MFLCGAKICFYRCTQTREMQRDYNSAANLSAFTNIPRTLVHASVLIISAELNKRDKRKILIRSPFLFYLPRRFLATEFLSFSVRVEVKSFLRTFTETGNSGPRIAYFRRFVAYFDREMLRRSRTLGFVRLPSRVCWWLLQEGRERVARTWTEKG